MNNLNELSHIWKRYPELVVILDTVSSLGGTKIDVDLHGIDACVSASQKALGLPPGLSFISLSGKAIKRMNQIGYKGYYLDLKESLRCLNQNINTHQLQRYPLCMR